MNTRILFFTFAAALPVAGLLIASLPEPRPLPPPDPRVRYTNEAAGRVGRPLQPQEQGRIQQAIDNIRTPPPDTLEFRGANGEYYRVPCGFIARVLQYQLDHGYIEVETREPNSTASTQNDGRGWYHGDRMNVKGSLVNPNGPYRLIHLEEVLIHEFVHKMQTRNRLRDKDSSEVEAYALELAYKDACDMDPQDKMYESTTTMWRDHQAAIDRNQNVRAWQLREINDHVCFLQYDSTNAGSDSFTTFLDGAVTWCQFPLGPVRGSDLHIIADPFTLPPGHGLAVIYGGIPAMGRAVIMGLNVLEGEVVAPPILHEFGPPLQPPMFFYSMTHSPNRERYYVLDSLNHRIMCLTDFNGDSLPDDIAGIYADWQWPGFELLRTMKGIDAGTHPVLGFGLSVNETDAHLPHNISPYAQWHFLPDLNGDHTADLLVPVTAYEFLNFLPAFIPPLPWMNDVMVMVYAPFQHQVTVWATDSLGETLLQPLGSVFMAGGVEAECMLLRPLLPAEFIIPMDETTGARPRLATRVVDSQPRNLTIACTPDGSVHLRWDAVPGAAFYNIYVSEDGVNFVPMDIGAVTNEIILPMFSEERFYYYVTAVRGE